MSIDLNKLNGCEIHKIVNSVEAKEKNSASPTDTWIINFKPRKKFKLTKDDNTGSTINSGFMKIWMSPDSYTKYYSRLNTRGYKVDDGLLSLSYEKEIYKRFVNHVLYNNICPNFIRYVTSGENCNFSSLLSFITNKTVNGRILRNPSQSLSKNLYDSIVRDERKELGEVFAYDRFFTNNIRQIMENSKYNFLVSENVQFPSLHSFVRRRIDTRDKYSNDEFSIFFQIIYACLIMEKFKLSHNDLHYENILIKELDAPINICYNITDDNGENKLYYFTTKYMPLIFDFDRAYWFYLGDNPFNNDSRLCKQIYQCNRNIPGRDLLQVIFVMYRYCENSLERNKILERVCKDVRYFPILRNLFSSKRGFNLKLDRGILEESIFNKLYSVSEILDNFYEVDYVNYIDYPSLEEKTYKFNNKMTCGKLVSRICRISPTVRGERVKTSPKRKAYKTSPKTRVCKEDEILNPATGYCAKKNGRLGRKILESHGIVSSVSPVRKTKKSRVCKYDEILNPATGYCAKKNGRLGRKILEYQGIISSVSPVRKSKKSRVCKYDEILNPATGYCAKKNGRLGRKILESQGIVSSVSPVRKSKKSRVCKYDEILNPATGYCAKKNGRLGKQILRDMMFAI